MTEPQREGQKYLGDERATEAAGAALGRAAEALCGKLAAALVVYLQGELGAGKTCLARGVMRGLGHAAAVKSPTYTLLEPYEETRIPVCHFDLYRLSDPGEVEFLGVDECFDAGRLCLVEWPERGAGCLPPADLVIRLTTHQNGRYLHWHAAGPAGAQLAESLSQE